MYMKVHTSFEQWNALKIWSVAQLVAGDWSGADGAAVFWTFVSSEVVTAVHQGERVLYVSESGDVLKDAYSLA